MNAKSWLEPEIEASWEAVRRQAVAAYADLRANFIGRRLSDAKVKAEVDRLVERLPARALGKPLAVSWGWSPSDRPTSDHHLEAAAKRIRACFLEALHGVLWRDLAFVIEHVGYGRGWLFRFLVEGGGFARPRSLLDIADVDLWEILACHHDERRALKGSRDYGAMERIFAEHERPLAHLRAIRTLIVMILDRCPNTWNFQTEKEWTAKVDDLISACSSSGWRDLTLPRFVNLLWQEVLEANRSFDRSRFAHNAVEHAMRHGHILWAAKSEMAARLGLAVTPATDRTLLTAAGVQYLCAAVLKLPSGYLADPRGSRRGLEGVSFGSPLNVLERRDIRTMLRFEDHDEAVRFAQMMDAADMPRLSSRVEQRRVSM